MQKMSAQFRELGSDVYLTTDKLTIDTSGRKRREQPKNSKEKSLKRKGGIMVSLNLPVVLVCGGSDRPPTLGAIRYSP